MESEVLVVDPALSRCVEELDHEVIVSPIGSHMVTQFEVIDAARLTLGNRVNTVGRGTNDRLTRMRFGLMPSISLLPP